MWNMNKLYNLTIIILLLLSYYYYLTISLTVRYMVDLFFDVFKVFSLLHSQISAKIDPYF